jgi:hypothetical protein
MPGDVLGGFRNYVGSVAANRDAGTVAVSSPQGNRLALIEARTGRLVQTRELVEVCGLAPDGDGFRASTGAGTLVDPDGSEKAFGDIAWDNHMLRIIA